MTAAAAMKAANAAGVQVELDGDDLVLEASAPPPAALLDLLSRHKAGIVALLHHTDGGWSAADWLVFYDEQAGIAEFDGALTREHAETHAFRACVLEWFNRNPAPSPPGRCAWCSRAEMPLAPFGTEHGGHAWLHPECWRAWQDSHEADAVAALAAMGIRNGGGETRGENDRPHHLEPAKREVLPINDEPKPQTQNPHSEFDGSQIPSFLLRQPDPQI